KLAITSYLLSLAVFIPASGWTADRFGARMVFSIAIGVFMLGSIGCALSTSVTDFVIARILQGLLSRPAERRWRIIWSSASDMVPFNPRTNRTVCCI
ncbi:MAG TPA: MFS transporter, partial [Ktedonobacteraceae bacterium]